jgi:hypothetical protein
MTRNKVTLLLSLFLITALSACNLPSAQGTPTPDIDLTVTAQLQLLDTATPGFPTETATPEFTSTPGFTPTPSATTVTVSVNTNCRTGPSTQYDLVGGLNVGQTAEVVGKNSAVANYWVVRLSGGAVCWLWGQYATVTGNTANLPEYPVPPTPTPSLTPTATSTPNPPAAPSNLNANKACTTTGAPPGFYYAGGTITWQDNSNDETGFNVYVGANLNGTTAANVTTHPIPPLLVTGGQPITMGVEAFNSGGKSTKVEITFSCP